MKTACRILLVTLVTLGVCAIAEVGMGQSGRPARPSGVSNRSMGATQRPAFSPYLNLLRTNSGPVQNYYGLVRPQQQFQSANDQFDSNFRSLQKDVDGVRNESDQSTRRTESGHNARFMTNLSSGLGSSMASRSDASQSVNGSRLAPSGHAVTFGNTSSYFPGKVR